MTLAARTVLDMRPTVDKYLSQTLLLAASWHRYASADADLQVRLVAGGSPALEDFLAELGAACIASAPGPNDGFSRSSNKILSADADAGGRRVLLLDNDVCCLGGLDGLRDVAREAISAAAPGSLRVSDAQWRLIEDNVGLPLLRLPFDAVNLAIEAADASSCRYLYANSGVVLLPAGLDFRSAWFDAQRRIRDGFEGHPLASTAVTASDQAGFAAAVAAHGAFAWLPLRFNYRYGGFLAGTETVDEIRLLHLTGDAQAGEGAPLARRIARYWETFIVGRFGRLDGRVSPEERGRRLEIAIACRDRVLAIVREYALDRVLDAVRADPGRWRG